MATDSTQVVIFDTTLRDGEQAPGFSLEVPAKVQMARALDALGVDIIEAGFPIASPADAEAVSHIAREVRRPVIAALARCRPQDIEEAARALAPAERRRIHTFLATSDLHLERKLRITRDACLAAVIDGVRRARKFTDDVEFSAEDATRSDRDFLCRVVESAIDNGATTINLPDTVGYSTPDETQQFFAEIIGRVPNADKAVFSAHCHDDLGLAVANTLAAITGGVRQVECAINGIGERAGNAALEEIVMALRVRKDRLPFDTAIQSPLLFETSQLLARLANEPVQANKAIVGRNAFAHEAGIHQDGVLKDARTYEIMRPQDVGQPAARLVLGRHSGRHAVQQRCEAIGLDVSAADLEQIYRAVITIGEQRKAVSDGDLRRIVARLRDAELTAATPSTHPDTAHPETMGYGHGV
jgi:2-isopropylmalate synthase